MIITWGFSLIYTKLYDLGPWDFVLGLPSR